MTKKRKLRSAIMKVWLSAVASMGMALIAAPCVAQVEQLRIPVQLCSELREEAASASEFGRFAAQIADKIFETRSLRRSFEFAVGNPSIILTAAAARCAERNSALKSIVLFNPKFIRTTLEATRDADAARAIVSFVFAHEIGHILNGDLMDTDDKAPGITPPQGEIPLAQTHDRGNPQLLGLSRQQDSRAVDQQSERDKECRADRFAGRVMRELGFHKPQSGAVLEILAPEAASGAYPSRAKRQECMDVGWDEGGNPSPKTATAPDQLPESEETPSLGDRTVGFNQAVNVVPTANPSTIADVPVDPRTAPRTNNQCHVSPEQERFWLIGAGCYPGSIDKSDQASSEELTKAIMCFQKKQKNNIDGILTDTQKNKLRAGWASFCKSNGIEVRWRDPISKIEVAIPHGRIGTTSQTKNGTILQGEHIRIETSRYAFASKSEAVEKLEELYREAKGSRESEIRFDRLMAGETFAVLRLSNDIRRHAQYSIVGCELRGFILGYDGKLNQGAGWNIQSLMVNTFDPGPGTLPNASGETCFQENSSTARVSQKLDAGAKGKVKVFAVAPPVPRGLVEQGSRAGLGGPPAAQAKPRAGNNSSAQPRAKSETTPKPPWPKIEGN